MEDLVRRALKSGWERDRIGNLFLRDDCSMHWAARREPVIVDGFTYLVPHWLERRLNELDNFMNYMDLAQKTANADLTDELRLEHGIVGIASEVFELSEAYDDIYEWGDICWFVAECCTALDLPFPVVSYMDGDIEGYVGELLTDYKAMKFYGKQVDLYKSLCDIVSCIRNLEVVQRLNIEKLKKRYPDGFNCTAALERADESV